MASITPPFAANEIWVAIGGETTFGALAPQVYYIGLMGRNDLPRLEQDQNQRPQWCTGLRVPVDWVPGAQAPTGGIRVRPLPAFGVIAGAAFTVTADPDNSPFAFPGSLPSYTVLAGGKYMDGTPFVYCWTGCVVDSVRLGWAEGEMLNLDFSWWNAAAWIQYNWDLQITDTMINVGEKPVMFHEGVFSDSGMLQGIEQSHFIANGTITMRRALQRAYGSGGQNVWKPAARACWNIKVLSHQIGANFSLYTPDGFAQGPNSGQNAPKWLGASSADLAWTDSASGNALQVKLYRVESSRSRMNAAPAERGAMFGMDWVAADWKWTYTA